MAARTATPASRLTTMVRLLLVLNIAIYLLQGVAGDTLIDLFALWPPVAPPAGEVAPGFMPWQMVTYSFLHGGPLHLAVNMLALWMFGRAIEDVLGSRRFALHYLASVVTAAATQMLVATVAGEVYPTVGASGGVFGLLLAFGLFFPRQRIWLVLPPIPMPAWLFVTLYALVELVLGVTGTQAGVAHFAHLGGMLGSYLMLRHFARAGPRR